MKIYLSHSSDYDYDSELYYPLKSSSLMNDNQIIFPHDKENTGVHSKDLIAHSDLVIADVSYPSTGQGIELGWADANRTPILCISNKNMHISGSLGLITNRFIEYENRDDMINKLAAWLSARK